MVYLGFLVAFLGLLHPTGASLRISTSSSQRAFAGSNVLLHCTFSGDGLTAGSRFLAIMWYYHGTEIVRYFEKVDISHPRVSFNEEEARRGNASILLSDVELQDEGIYSCLVIYGQEKKEQQIILNVLVPPKIQIFSKAVSEENTLVCSVTGFYPEEIAVTWLRDGELLRNSSLGKKQRNADGTYSVNSTVIIPIPPDRDPRNEAVSCRVRHESLSEPLQEDFQLVYGGQTEETSTVTVIVCVCGALVLAAGIGWLMWRLKPWKKGGFTLSEIAGPDKLIDGEGVTLCCTGNLCAENTQVIWLKKKAGGEAETIPNPGGDLEEAEQLLNTLYVIETKDEGSQRYSSNLRFKFHVKNHKGVTFICRFISGNKTLEKRFHCTNINDFISHPHMEEITVSDQILWNHPVELTCKISRFYPDNLTVEWLKQEAGSQKKDPIDPENYWISSPISLQTDGTYSCTACLKITPTLMSNGIKCTCRVRHPSLRRPKEKRKEIHLFTGKPEVSDIKESGSGSFYLEVNKFYPRDIQITWRLDEASGENQCQSLSSSTGDFAVNADGTYKVTSTCEPLGDKADKSKTYYLKAFVNHVSLETEVQKTKVFENGKLRLWEKINKPLT